MHKRLLSLTVIGATVLCLSGCDVTAPRFIRFNYGFVVGTDIPASDPDDPAARYTRFIPSRISWAATDDDGGCPLTYDVYAVASDGSEVLTEDDLAGTASGFVSTDFHGDVLDGHPTLKAWRIEARDCAGNVREMVRQVQMAVYQEDGRGPTRVGQELIERSGTWTAEADPLASGGRREYTSEQGAWVSFSMDFVQAQNVAVVMPVGPGRGWATIHVDDVHVATIDTNAPSDANGHIVFNRRMPNGTHTIRVENAASDGHPRIDIDAFLVSLAQ